MKFLLSKPTVVSLLTVLVIVGGYLTVTKTSWLRSGMKNYDLEMIKDVEPMLVNEVSKDPRLVIVNFWASWCPPCIQETPSMLEYAKKHSDKIQLHLVSEDSSPKEIRDFIKAFPDIHAVNLRIIWDANRKIGQNFKVYKMPETFVFDNKGRLLQQFSGSLDWSSPELDKTITEHFQN